MIIKHIDDVHQRSVVVRDNYSRVETPDTPGEYSRDVADVPDPWIVHYLELIVINKIAGKGVEIYGERNKQ